MLAAITNILICWVCFLLFSVFLLVSLASLSVAISFFNFWHLFSQTELIDLYVGKVQIRSQQTTAACFVNKVLVEHSHTLLLTTAELSSQPTKSKILALWPFAEKVCRLLVQIKSLFPPRKVSQKASSRNQKGSN